MKKTILTEKKIIQRIRDILGSPQVVRFSPGPYSPNGVPDLLLTGDYIPNTWLEIKINNAKFTTAQLMFLKKVQLAALLHVDSKLKVLTFYTNGLHSFPYARSTWLAELARQLGEGSKPWQIIEEPGFERAL